MGRSARVRSIDTLEALRAALAEFGQEAGDALVAISMEVRHTLEWLGRDQLAYWKREIRDSRENLLACKANLDRCKMMRVADHEPSCYEERQAVRAARQRQARAEQKLEAVQHWIRTLDHEVCEYEGRVGQLARWLESDLPRARARLGKMSTALAAYAGQGPPQQPAESTGSTDRDESETTEPDAPRKSDGA